MGERERKNEDEGGERNLYKSVLNFIAFEAVLQLALWLWEKVTDWGTFGVSAATAAGSAGVSAAVLTVLGSKCSKKAKANCILAMLLFLLLVVFVVVVVALLIMQARSSQAEPRVVLAPSAIPLATLATLAANRWHFCMPSSRFQFCLRKWALGSNACLGCHPSLSLPLSLPLSPLDYLLSAAVAPVRSRSQVSFESRLASLIKMSGKVVEFMACLLAAL